MGVIGLGGISTAHIEGILNSPDGELVAICDIREEVLKDKGVKYGIPESRRFKNHIELLQCPDVDAVSICTPNKAHYHIAKDVIYYGKPFILEKPVTLNYQQALELKELTNSKKIPNMVAFSYRFKAALRFAKWIIEQGYLGRIFHIYVQYFQSWAINEEVPLVWRFIKEYSGSGALGDLGSHMIDIARFLIGDFVKVCGHVGTFVERRKKIGSDEYGEVDVDDYCHFMAELEDGVIGNFCITRDAYGRGNYQRVEVYGSKGGLVYNLDKKGDHIDTIEVCIGDLYGRARDYHEIPVPSQFKAEQMQSFFDIVNGKGDGLAATIDDGYVNQYIIDCILESTRLGKWVTLEKTNKI